MKYMKKILFIVSLFSFATLVAQTYEPLPDGNFDEWTKKATHPSHDVYHGEDYDDLANPFWKSLNELSTLPPEMSTGPVTLFKVQGRSGFAPMVKSDTLWVGEEKLFLPGVFGAFTLDITNKTARFGRVYHSRPDSLVGYMKYAPVSSDSASIFVELYKKIGQVKVIIGRVERKFHSNINDWTRFSMPIEYIIEEDNEDGMPDSVSVLFVASAAYNFDDLFTCKGQPGTTLWIDECSFVFNKQASIEKVERENYALVYPNPTSGDVFVKLNSSVKTGRVEIIDIRGSIVKTQRFEGESVSLDIRSLRPALYMYRIVSGERAIKSGRINLIR
ncbi:MAG: PCMD domain-containing protein [Bacteroidales bacterium]|nr:PCMD domain-containing protein [Bacteroidales bacterium]